MLTRPNGAISWSQTHHSTFAPDKYALICFTRKRSPNPDISTKSTPMQRPPIQLPRCTIQPTTSTKYLGVLLDQELRFKEHANYPLAKGTAWVLHIRRLTQPSVGLPLRYVRQLFIGAVIPKVLYAADVFCADRLHHPKTNSGFIGKLSRIQRLTTILITGALPSTATDSLDVHSDLLPFRHMVQRVCLSAAIRLVALPNTHPLYPEIKKKRLIKRHRTSIYTLIHHFQLDPSKIEKIPSIRSDPKDPPYHTVHIATDMVTAHRNHLT